MMTRLCSRYGSDSLLSLVDVVEQDRLLGGIGVPIWLDDRLSPVMLLLLLLLLSVAVAPNSGDLMA